MKTKKINSPHFYQEAQKDHLNQHRDKILKSGFKIIPQKQFNKLDRTQEFYKVYQRQFRSSIMMKHGYKISSLELQEQDLALYCFSLLQAEATFPIKIFTVDHGSKKHILDPDQGSRKDLWMQTHILVSGLTNSSQQQNRFETKIYGFFNDYLLKKLREFMKKRINWDYMVTSQYTDEKVIMEFQQQVIIPANVKFQKTFN